ncbi:MAG: NapH/MauN family ferredoxin-type protein [Magnetococcales bacterium]|nr:NapH/MauN family ferredoxin-type protein [Magnetococcales bacterium]
MARTDNKLFSLEAAAIHAVRRNNFRQRMRTAVELRRAHIVSHTWRKRRWLTMLLVNGLLVLGCSLDWQVLGGTLSTSRIFGLPLSEPFAALQLFLATRSLPADILLGALIIGAFYMFVGGRAFCSWVCPYTLLAEWGDMLHVRLRKKGWVREHPFSTAIRYWMAGIFLLLTTVTGYAIFENISTMAILSRAMIYGPGVALVWVGLVLVFEIVYSRRAWCRYLCPLGVLYGLLGTFSLVRVRYSLKGCHHDGACRKVCPVPGALDVTKAGRAPRMLNRLNSHCTSCGRCVDTCPTNSLQFSLSAPWPLPFSLPVMWRRKAPKSEPCYLSGETRGPPEETAGGSSEESAGTKRSMS